MNLTTVRVCPGAAFLCPGPGFLREVRVGLYETMVGGNTWVVSRCGDFFTLSCHDFFAQTEIFTTLTFGSKTPATSDNDFLVF